MMEGTHVTWSERRGNMTTIAKNAVLGTTLLIGFLVGPRLASSLPAGGSLSISVKNETGYDLEEVKCVLERGNTKALVERAGNVTDGSSCTFHLNEEGAYRVYASLTTGGEKVYAKGNAYNLDAGGNYILTLKKVIINKGGAGMEVIDKNEFDAIK
jgi:hypothetical protein